MNVVAENCFVHEWCSRDLFCLLVHHGQSSFYEKNTFLVHKCVQDKYLI
jgi:hypothetical protein